MKFTHTFQNSGDLINNDVVLPGAPFRIEEIVYNFLLTPKCKYWRFGIRLSKTFMVDFYMPDHRYKQPDFDEKYIDIHIGVGQWDGEIWKDENEFHLAQYNVPGMSPLITVQEYVPMAQVGWSLNFTSQSPSLIIYFDFADSQKKNIAVHELSLPPEFRYFKVFAWADKSPLNIDCELSINPIKNESTSTDFKIGNILFRRGDMFDYVSQKMANIFILPASAYGTATPNILDRALELGIPNPEQKKVGSVDLYLVTNANEWMRAGYGYSTDENGSSLDTIAEIAMTLHDKIVNDRELIEKCRAISLPLLGTGAGMLSPVLVASTFDGIFNAGVALNYIVNILEERAFYAIKEFFTGRYEAIKEIDGEISPPPGLVDLLQEYNLSLTNVKFSLNEKHEVSQILFNNSYINFGGWPKSLQSVTDLTFTKCDLLAFDFIRDVKKLRRLSITSSITNNLNAIKSLTRLISLELSDIVLDSLSFLNTLNSLRTLRLRNMNLKSLNEISNLNKLEELDLRSNKLQFIDTLKYLINLRRLLLPYNELVSLQLVVHLKKLEVLDVSNNHIQDLTPIAALKKLKYLRVSKNPVIQKERILLDETANHLLTIRNFLLKKGDEDTVYFRLPCKILLLGNHGSGKSTLLDKIFNRSIKTKGSTHIIKLEKYITNEDGIPNAIFFDFGGQDYYHGLYKAFLSGGSAYILLFNLKNNLNKRRLDSNNIQTQDFSLQYWLSQKQYFEQQVFHKANDPLFLVQTHSDEYDRLLRFDLTAPIQDTYYVSLIDPTEVKLTYKQTQDKNNLSHLIDSIRNYIDYTSEVVKRPRWFVEFVKNILRLSEKSTYEAIPINDLLDFYDRPGDFEEVKAYMLDDLDQLHKQGIVLYYKDHLPNIVWLDPVAVVNYVHDKILVKDRLIGKLGLTQNEIESFDSHIIKLLQLQKVLFFHEHGQLSQYIVPNFLPLFEEELSGAGLLMFGLSQPCIILRFKNFIPFGLINQLICFFGALPEYKKFWRDKLLFKIGSTKVCIDVDMQLLEIRLFTISDSVLSRSESITIERFLFLSIIGQYWSIDILSFNDFVEFENSQIIKDSLPFEHPVRQKIENIEALIDDEACRPIDLYISRDNKSFVSYVQLCTSDGASSIAAYQRNIESGEITEKVNIIEAYPFQVFTKAKLKKAYKAVISYSKQDLEHVLKFRQYLEPLRVQGLLDQDWFCTLLLAGEEWETKIKKEFEAADIIFFMVSENLMTTPYVKEHEIKNAIDKFDSGGEVLIIPILLVPYNFKGLGRYDLMRFSSLPYSLKPITQFPNRNLGWHIVSEIIRITLERKLDPSKVNDPFYPQLERFLAAIINGNKIAESDML